MKYLNPEMEIVELDERILTETTGLSNNGSTDLTPGGDGLTMPETGVQ